MMSVASFKMIGGGSLRSSRMFGFVLVVSLASSPNAVGFQTTPAIPEGSPSKTAIGPSVDRIRWTKPAAGTVAPGLLEWAVNESKKERDELKPLVQAIFDENPARHQRLLRFAADISVEVDEILKQIRRHPSKDFNQAVDDIADPSVSAHLKLQMAIERVRANLHDEALSLLSGIPEGVLIDPATRLFYLGVCHHQLVQSEEARDALEELVVESRQIPERYRSVAAMILSDIEAAKPNSAAEIPQLMADAGRRQSLERHGATVLKQEEQILDRLDKLINELEKQKQKQQAMAQSGKSGSRSSTPQSKSAAPASGGPNGTGDVDAQPQSDDGRWGGLSGEAKSIAVNNLVRDLPPHFRGLIEAYFQKLAEQTK